MSVSMKNRKYRAYLLTGAVAAWALSSTVASATVWSLEATLDGLQEVGPTGSAGTGFATLSLDDATGLVTILTGTFQDLGTGTTAGGAHIHGLAGVGTNANVLIPLTIATGVTSGTFSGSGTLSAPNVTGMLNGFTYINLHTTGFPNGEIRGQIVLVPEPATVSLLALGAIGIIACRRRWIRKAIDPPR